MGLEVTLSHLGVAYTQASWLAQVGRGHLIGQVFMLYGTINVERVENNGSLYSVATLPTAIAKINCCYVYHMAGAFIRYYKQLAKAARLVLAEKMPFQLLD